MKHQAIFSDTYIGYLYFTTQIVQFMLTFIWFTFLTQMQNLTIDIRVKDFLVARHLGEGELQLLGDPLVLLLLRHKLILQPVHLKKS